MQKSILNETGGKNLLYILPGLLVYVLFVFGPIVAAFVLSFTKWNGIGTPSFIGLDNYLKLFSDHRFLVSLRNNAVLILFYSAIPLVIGLVLSSIISRVRQGQKLALRTLFFLPYMMPVAVLGIIWQWLYNPAFGPINQGLKIIGLGALTRPWLGDFDFALPAVGLVASWYFFGFCMVFFMTGMQRLDPSLFEASHIDGASGFQTFYRVTVPLLLPEIRVVLLLTIIASIKSFGMIFTMTRGGPSNSTLVPNIYMYDLGFHLNRFGYAACVAIIGALLVFAVNYAIHRLIRPAKEVS